MATFKDHFSTQSSGYSSFRPMYPESLYQYLSDLCLAHDMVWDCATGTGQAARGLSPYFAEIIATDGSESQIAKASGPNNIRFKIATAESSGLPSDCIDLITVAQALHWFSFDDFYRETKRVLKPKGILAVWTYNLLIISDDINDILNYFNDTILGNYWPREREYVRNDYRDIHFPFAEIDVPEFHMKCEWTLHDLLGYLSTWSSVVAYKAQHDDQDPLKLICDDLCTAWGEPEARKMVKWPLTLKVGRN